MSIRNGLFAQTSRGAQPPTRSPVPHHLRLAFLLISGIPVLICGYLIVVRFLSIWILVELPGIYFLILISLAVVGVGVGHHLIHDTIERLQQAHADLKKSHEELQTLQLHLIHAEKLQSVGRLAAGIAHEVKNPLQIIRMGVCELSKRLARCDNGVGDIVKDLSDAVHMADIIIRGLLDFSIPTALELKADQLNGVIEQSLSLVKSALAKSHVAVSKELGTDLPPVRVDRNKLEQVFVNLFMNAVQAMPGGGVLTVKTYVQPFAQACHVRDDCTAEPLRPDELLVVAEVDDTGIGIPEDKLAQVFEPFFTTKPIGEGTGLGLAVARKIIEWHQGTLTVKNRNGGGVKATITLRVHYGP